MYKKKIVIGVAPTKRSFLSMEEAKRQKDCFMTVIRGIDSEAVTLVDLDNVCENGIAFRLSDVPKAVKNSERRESKLCLSHSATLARSKWWRRLLRPFGSRR